MAYLDGHNTDAAQVAHDQTTLEGTVEAQKNTVARPIPRQQKEATYRQSQIARQQALQLPLTTFLLGKVQQLRSQDSEARKQHNRDVGTFFQYYDGNEYGEFNDAGEWRNDAQNSEDELAYSFPLVPGHVDAAKTLLLKTLIEYEYEPIDKISTLDAELAKMCEELAEEAMSRLYGEDGEKRTSEALNLLLAGKSYRHHYWAKSPIDAKTTEVPNYSQETVEAAGAKSCSNPECGAPWKPEDAVCPRCKSDQFTEAEKGKVVKTTHSTKTLSLAENQLYIPNSLAVQHDLSKSNILHSFVVERDVLPRSEAEFQYSQVFPELRRGISEESRMVFELERLKIRTSSSILERDGEMLRSLGNYEPSDLVERERVWLQPWQYANFLITEEHWYLTKQDGLVWCEDPKTMPEDAEHIQPNTFLGEVATRGCFVCVVDDSVAEIQPDDAGSDRWVKLIFGQRPSNTDGAGMRRLRPLADMANDSMNLEFKVLMDDADPKTFLNRQYVSSLSQVGNYTLVDNLQAGDKAENVAWRLQGASSHPALGVIGEKVHAFAQFLAKTFSPSGGGAPDVKAAGTATGVVKMAEEAAGGYIEAILQMKSADIDSRFKVLENIRRRSIEPQKKDIERRFGLDLAKRFFSLSNIRSYVSIKSKKGTDQPQSQAIRLAQIQAYGDAVASVGQHPQAISIIESFGELINLPVTVGIGMADREEAKKRLGILRELAQPYSEKQIGEPEAFAAAGQIVSQTLMKCEAEPVAPEPPPMPMAPPMMDPGMGEGMPLPPMPPAPPPPPDIPTVVMMQDHMVFQDAYKDFLLGEGGRTQNRVLMMGVQMMWKLHYEREQIKKQEMMRREALVMLEGKKVEAEFMQAMSPPPPAGPTPEDIAAQEAAAKEEALAQEVGGRIADEEAKNAEFQRQEAAKDADLIRKADEMELQASINEEAAEKAAKNEKKGEVLRKE
ncbi:MAG: hypothetical protein ABL984_13970 [Pyrinomonadaceae bacterium]